MSKILIAGNWKCNPASIKAAKSLFNAIKKGVRNSRKTEIVIAPPFVYLSILSSVAKNSKIVLGAQNVFLQEGAFTGEVSPHMLRDIGVKYVIVGHSERRAFGETDDLINKKIKAVMAARLTPILCIGENKKERKEGRTKEVLERELKIGLQGISKVRIYTLAGTRSDRQNSKLVVAYEPIWAIGSGHPCQYNDAMSIGILIRRILREIVGKKAAEDIRILYGGSVNSKDAPGFIKESLMDGLLIGGASLKADEFLKIVKEVG